MFNKTIIDGVLLRKNKVIIDERGSFTKSFVASEFMKYGLCVNFTEEFYSFSKKDVVRGMHFQMPPAAHDKVVYCAMGRVLDVVLDLRRMSTTYKKFLALEVSAAGGEMLYIPKGCAHGFLAIEDSIMVYKLETEHSPENDTGISWESFGFKWPVKHPTLSGRDLTHIDLDAFRSPF
jgi:dTDP-4-dehydrorhamnose 3,5-epimerase